MLVVFFISLPAPVGLPDGAIYSFIDVETRVPELEGVHIAQRPEAPAVESGGEMLCSLRFWQELITDPLEDMGIDAAFRLVKRILPSLLPDDEPAETDAEARERLAHDVGAYITVVEAVTPVTASDPDPDSDAFTDAFERCFEQIDQTISAYRLYARQPVPRLTREQLPPIIPFATRPLLSAEGWHGLSLFFLHLNVGAVRPEELDEAELETFNLYLETVSRGHPLALYSEKSLDAETALKKEGRFGDAVVHAQTSIEILLDALLALLVWEEGKTPDEAAAEEFQDAGFQKRVRTHFHTRLGGDWRTEGGDVLTRWAEHVAAMRHRVVHAGYRPTREEARLAVAVAGEVEKFVRHRVIDRRNTYPRTALLMLGRPGLERAGVWAGRIQRFAERADSEPPWIESFASWRGEMDDARSQ